MNLRDEIQKAIGSPKDQMPTVYARSSTGKNMHMWTIDATKATDNVCKLLVEVDVRELIIQQIMSYIDNPYTLPLGKLGELAQLASNKELNKKEWFYNSHPNLPLFKEIDRLEIYKLYEIITYLKSKQ
jgi:hypothetical protein